MSITQKSLRELLEKISNKFEIELSDLQDVAKDILKKDSPFTPLAKKLAAEHNLSASDIAHSGDKITLDDVRAVIGAPAKKKQSDAFTAKARVLAAEHNLSDSDFPDSERSGKVRKTGVKEISVADIRKKIGAKKEDNSPKGSPRALQMARQAGIDLAKVKGTGKDGRILKADIEKLLKKEEESSSDSSDSE